ncbi:uncharacterized protein LACBIDRAFT_299691 [Laccaria bicolor S238N-H82]|uniref:Predicted protein n=1 Tax=Laccaria bicolor (strain S238N-H82 / ATCC MYA-4686) TaxID=486041 RepID=B0DF67_LACBS|nr:uncharacterized protein LACBIDRAFT_299691 [Laccaria bicolor S238N-H82]EDR06660.1 predicted protein [Laccaria bicolor S238N-H82]|eukprot:XP_001882507.1 predicted protein [Laccaria bicolor S238N-H82]
MAEPEPAQPPPEQIGVVYTPSTDPQLKPSTPFGKKGIKEYIENLLSANFNFVRIQWVDLINDIRYRVVTKAYFAKLLHSSARPGVSITKCALGLVFLSVADGFSPIGEYLYVLDLSSLRLCGYQPRHAAIMGWFQEKTPLPGRNGRLSYEVDLCPRTILRRVVEKAKNELSLSFLIGVESEFILLTQTHPIEAVNNHGWSNSAALPSGSVEAKVLEEIADALSAAEIELQMYHAEAAPGQYEVVTGPLGPLQAADALVHTRETIYNVASKHGLRATFAPRVYMDSCGSAAHTHISIHSSSPPSPSTSSPNLTSLEASFLAGLLTHLPSLTILTLPLSASYKRMVDGAWSGGTYVCWGTDNREAPIRLCNATSPASRNFEVKCVDGTSNPYLAFAGLIAAGVEGGVKINRALEVRDCSAHGELGKTAAEMGEEERVRFGITERLPLNWEEAREAFRGDAVLGEVFGEAFVTGYLNVNKTLKEKMSVKEKLTDGLDEEATLKLLVENY